MSDGRELLSRFLEQRSQFSEDELESLVVALREDPALAVELKDQLILDELLAQRFDLARYHFGLQVAQRLEDESAGDSRDRILEIAKLKETAKTLSRTSPTSPESETAFEQTLAVATPQATSGTAQLLPVSRRTRWPRTLMGASVLVVFAMFVIWQFNELPGIARVEFVSGIATLVRQHRELSLDSGDTILPQDRIIVQDDSKATIRFPDGTAVKIESASEMIFVHPDETASGRCLFMARGAVSADVVPQPPGKPLVFQSENALAEVLGTSLRMQVAPHRTQVTVTQGTVRVERKLDHESIVVSKDNFAIVTPETLSVVPIEWPSDRKGLIFLFETNDRPNLVRSNSTGMNRSFSLRPRGHAHLNHDYAMVLTDGAFLAEDVDGEILAASRQSNELTVEATIRPELNKPLGEGPARIVTFSTTVTERDFTIGQDQDRLVVRIRTPQTGPNGVQGVDNGLPVCTLAAGEVHHLIVSYKPGRLVCHLNGKLVFDGNQIQGDFSGWSAQHLLFGDEYGGGRNWAGELEGVALYSRFLEPEEAQRNAFQYDHLRRSRASVPRFKVLAELTGKSAVPTVSQIQPHRSALLTCKYNVKQVLNGKLDQKSISVAQWAILDGKSQPIVGLRIGSVAELSLEPFERNRQAQPYLYSDDYSLGDSSSLFFCVR